MRVKAIANSKIKLPTRNVLECITGTLTTKSKKEPEDLIKTIADVVDFEMTPKDIKDIMAVPLMFDMHMLYAGNILKNKNSKLKILSEKLKKLPLETRSSKIEETIEKLGKKINVEI